MKAFTFGDFKRNVRFKKLWHISLQDISKLLNSNQHRYPIPWETLFMKQNPKHTCLQCSPNTLPSPSLQSMLTNHPTSQSSKEGLCLPLLCLARPQQLLPSKPYVLSNYQAPTGFSKEISSKLLLTNLSRKVTISYGKTHTQIRNCIHPPPLLQD